MLLNKCKSCDADRLVKIYKDQADGKYVVMCEVCGKSTKYYAAVSDAVAEWNEKNK
jgi:transcription elongation factor Elf1